MTSTKVIGVIAAVALILGGLSYFRNPSGLPSPESLGSAGGLLVENYDPYNRYNDGYKSENEIVLSGADGDLTVGDDILVSDDVSIADDLFVVGGTLTVTTVANATSTLTIGEIETYATSSDTKICLKFSTVATSSTPVANNGFVLWAYGVCP